MDSFRRKKNQEEIDDDNEEISEYQENSFKSKPIPFPKPTTLTLQRLVSCNDKCLK